MDAPKIHRRGRNRFVILDRPDTPFWWAEFRTEADALAAWDSYWSNLMDAAINAEQFPTD